VGSAAGHRTLREQVLAIMGKLATNNIVDRARHKIPRLFHSSARLRDHAGFELLPAADHPNDRHTQSSNAVAAQRQRSALEALIANVAPAQAASLSSALLNEFSSIGRVFSETSEAIERVVGKETPIPALLRSAHDACIAGLASDVRLRRVGSVDQRLIDYLTASMGAASSEQMRVLFLNRQRCVVGDEILASGSLHELTVYPRTIFKRALELSASILLLVHNHPGGVPIPSECDKEFTARIAKLGRQLEIEIGDHIIIAGTRWFSFAKQGLL
jgi:DNA repair protein RadC